MSYCGGNCGCGSDCNCGTACAGCKMNADLSYTENPAQTAGLVSGVAPHTLAEAEDNGGCGGCKCGSDCKCDPCNCN